MKILVTGAAGYIGSKIVEKYKNSHEVISLVRNRMHSTYGGVREINADILDKEKIDEICEKIDVVFHCACPTASRFLMSHPDETYTTIVDGTSNILRLADRCGVDKFVFLSSMEVYGVVEETQDRVDENVSGYIDKTNPRSCYPLGKLEAEKLCLEYAEKSNIQIMIARLAQTFGGGILASDNRVFAQFARAVVNEQDIILNTTGESMGNYCHIDDTIDALDMIMRSGASGQIYNVVNEESTMTIMEMARMVAKDIANDRIKVVINTDNNNYGYAPVTKLRLSGDKLHKLGFEPQKGIKEMYLDAIKCINKN